MENTPPLHHSIADGNIESVLSLLDQVTLKDSNGNTPLHVATTYHKEKIVKLLLDHGADVGVKNNNELTPVELALNSRDLTLVKIFINAGASVNTRNQDGVTALHLAAVSSNLSSIEYFLKLGADVNVRNIFGLTPLDIVVQSRKDDSTKLKLAEVLLAWKADVNSKDKWGESLLHYAAANGKLNIVECLLKNKANVNLKNLNGETPLISAIQAKNLDIVKLLIDHRADINNIAKTQSRTPLNSLRWPTDRKIIECLLEKGANVNLPDAKGFTPIMRLLRDCIVPYPEFLKLLLDHGADINVATPTGKNVLSFELEECCWKAILKHIAKLQTANRPVNANLINTISARRDYKRYYIECKQELLNEKNT